MSDKKNFLKRDRRRYLLPSERAWGAETHSYLPELCDQLNVGKIHRRDFLRQACLLGMTATTAYTMAGILTGEESIIPEAMAQTPKPGGTLRVSMRIQEMTDPASFNWVEPSNVARFMIEHLSRTRADNVTVPYLAEKWEASDDLKSWVFHLRKGIKWSNGDDFNSADVAHNVNRWLDPATGSSNLGLFDGMVEQVDTGEKDKDGKPKMTKRGIEGAVEVVDDHTIKFNLKQAALAMPENFYNYPTAIVHRASARTMTPICPRTRSAPAHSSSSISALAKRRSSRRNATGGAARSISTRSITSTMAKTPTPGWRHWPPSRST